MTPHFQAGIYEVVWDHTLTTLFLPSLLTFFPLQAMFSPRRLRKGSKSEMVNSVGGKQEYVRADGWRWDAVSSVRDTAFGTVGIE